MKTGINKYKELFQKQWLNNLFFWLTIVFLPVVWAYTAEVFRRDEIPSFLEYIWLRRQMASIGYFVLLLVFVAITMLVRRIAVSSLIISSIIEIGGFANYYMLLYRKSPVVPLDLFEIGNGIAVVHEDMQFPLTREMWIMLVFFLLVSALLWFVQLPAFFKKGSGPRRVTVSAAVIAVCLCTCYFFVTRVVQDEEQMVAWGYPGTADTAQNSYFSTFVTNFLYMTRYLNVEAPQNYTSDTMQAIADQINRIDTGGAARPDVILVVAESWHSLDMYDVELSDDPFENYARLGAQGTTGSIFSPYYGGGTANIEFELLTGLPTSVGNLSSTMFNTAIYENFPSIANHWRSTGYTTIALHAHTSTLYNRISAYQNLGFDSAYFADSFDEPTRNGDYIDDQSCIEKAIQLYEQAIAADNAPVFMHVLTMEGHLFYGEERLEGAENPIYATGGDYTEEQLATLSSAATIYGDTDRAIGMLADYLQTLDRDVVLIVVGDHQSPMRGEDETQDVPDPPTEDILLERVTPYLVWTNYDVEMPETFGTIPHNMLLPKALEALHVDRSKLFDYLADSLHEINGVDSNYVLGADGLLCDDPTDAQLAEIAERELVRYDLVSGKRYLLSGAA